MNYADARAAHDGNGWKGEFRLSWKADYESVMLTDSHGRKTENIRYFSSPIHAELEAWRLKNTLEQSVMTRDGAMIGDLSEADAAFPGLRPMKRRKVEVETKKGRC